MDNIRGITIDIGGNTTKLQKALADVTRQSKLTRSALKDIEKSMKFNTGSLDLVSQKQRELGKAIDLTKQRLEMLKTAQNQMTEGYKGTEEGKRQYDNLSREIQKTENILKSYETQLTKLSKEELEAAQASKLRQIQLESLRESQDKLKRDADKLSKSYELQKVSLGNNATESDKLKLKQELLAKSLINSKQQVEHLERALSIAKEEYGANAREVDKLESELIEAKIASQQFSNQYIDATSRAKIFGDRMNETGKKVSNVGRDMTQNVSIPLSLLGVAAGKTAMDFESAFVGVRKTVDATEIEFAALEEGIREMAKTLPTAASEIANVAEVAGQLGIRQENLLKFSRTMIDLGESTALSAEVAASELARFANITGMSIDDIDKLGSTIVDLGNKFATTEPEIVEMSMRIAGMGTEIGLSEAEIMAFSTALSSVGIEAQMGGTAISTAMSRMYEAVETGSDKLESFAKVAGMSGKEFTKLFKEDASSAIEQFIIGLGKIDQDGGSAILTLEELGLKEIRVRDTMLRLSNASGELTRALNVGSSAWNQNTALTVEAEKRYASTESQLKITINRIKDIGISLGKQLLPMVLDAAKGVESFMEKLSNLSPETLQVIVRMGALAAAIGPVLFIFGKLMSVVGTVSGALAVVNSGASAATPVIAGLAKVFGLFGSGAAAAGTATAGAGTAIGTAAGGVTLLGTAVTGVIAPLAVMVGSVMAVYNAVKWLKDKSLPDVELFSDGVSEATQQAVESFLTLERDANTSLNALSWSSQAVTEEIANDFVTKFQKMTETIRTELTTQKDESLGIITEMWQNNNSVTEQELEEMVSSTTEAFDNAIGQHERYQQRAIEIIAKAKEEKRALTEGEKEDLAEIQNAMKENGVKILSQSEAEHKVIMQRMKDNSSILSAEAAAEVIKSSVKQRDETIKNADEELQKRLVAAEQIRALGGAKAEETANKSIEEAIRQRDEVVGAARDMHENVVSEAEKQAGEHIDHVNTETGEIKSNWEMLGEFFAGHTEDTKGKYSELNEGVQSYRDGTKVSTDEMGFSWATLGDKIKENIEQTDQDLAAMGGSVETLKSGTSVSLGQMGVDWQGLSTTVSTSMGDAVTKISEAKDNGIRFASEMKSNIGRNFESMASNAGKSFTSVRDHVSGKLNEARSIASTRASQIFSTVKDRFDSIPNTARNAFEAVRKAISDKMESIKTLLRDGIEKAKSYFRVTFPIPKIRLPNITVTGGFSLNPPSVPKFNLKWYDKGGIFRSPSVIGVGEKRPEFVGALDDLKTLMGEVIDEKEVGLGGSGIGILIQEVRNLSKAIQNTDMVVNMDGREVGKGVYKYVDEYSERETKFNTRRRGEIY